MTDVHATASDSYIVDSHHHFQDIETYDYPWLNPLRPEPLEGDLSGIRRNFLPAEYGEIVSSWQIRKSVHVQNGWTDQDPVGETRWISSLIEENDLSTVIVGYADLSQPDVGQILHRHMALPAFRGVRQILNWHEDDRLRVASRRDLMQQADWRRGFEALVAADMSFDLQIYWPQMEMALELAQDYPQSRIVLDHFGMPIDRSVTGMKGWRQALKRLSSAGNVYVKLSGYGLGNPNWSTSEMIPLLHEIIRIFGTNRVMFGSNLPVDLLFSPVRQIVETFEASIAFLPVEDRDRIRHANAEVFYRF